MYEEGQTTPSKQNLYTDWLLGFTENRPQRNKFIKKCIAEFAAKHLDILNTDDSSVNKGSDTLSVYTTTQSDSERLEVYQSANYIPDETAATIISEAKARAHNTALVPASVVIEAKRNTLEYALEDPWDSVAYASHLEDVRRSGRERKRSETPPPLKEKRERYKAIVDNYHTKVAERWDSL